MTNFLSAAGGAGLHGGDDGPGMVDHGAHGGNTWDGLTPLTGGTANPTGATLNSTFWARVDYFLTTAASYGITVGLVHGQQATIIDSRYWHVLVDHHAVDEFRAALIGARYASTPNLVWLLGNDAFSRVCRHAMGCGPVRLIAAAGDTQWSARGMTPSAPAGI